jgi:hypothetical protein
MTRKGTSTSGMLTSLCIVSEPKMTKKRRALPACLPHSELSENRK